MRIQVLEDRNCFLTRLKYYMESAAHAQERFDSCRPKWRRAGEPDPCFPGRTVLHHPGEDRNVSDVSAGVVCEEKPETGSDRLAGRRRQVSS